MSRPRPSASKRNIQQHKREKAQASQQRRAARRLAAPQVDATPVEASETELIEELARIHSSLETGTMSPEEFDQRREHIRLQLEQIERSRGS
jgi:hypothetical protein